MKTRCGAVSAGVRRGTPYLPLLWLFAAALPECGQDVAQTAQRGAEPEPSLPPIVCTEAPAALALPNDDTFGDGTEEASNLVGSGYGAGQGPGLYITARGAFRAYLNGQLLRESSEPSSAEFIPLTVLPGDNALSIVVAAASGAPALLVQLDELERSVVSDASWKVSAAPGSGFRDADYDDSGWSSATDFGAITALPSCDLGLIPESSAARWVGASAESGSALVLRKTLRIAAIGYGAATTGGFGAEPMLLDSWEQLSAVAEEADTPAVILLAEGIHDFRRTGSEVGEQPVCASACPNDASKLSYTILTGTETCPDPLVTETRNERTLNLGSNKTLVGLGRGAALRGVSLNFGASQNLIARNLAVFDVNPHLIEAGDAFGLIQPSDVWIDHCTTKWISDGFTDARAGSQNITLSWLHYDGANPAACSGKHPRASQIADSTVTFHHCFFDHVDSHAPAADHPQARVHLFNNLISDNPDYGVGSACGSQVLMEGNIFETVLYPTERMGCADDARLGLIQAPAGSNLYRDDVGMHRGGDGQEPRDSVFTPPYDYTVDPPQTAWLEVLSRAGAGGPWALPLSLE